MRPLITPIMTMNISGSKNPPVFGIPLKKAVGDVKTLIAVFCTEANIEAKSIDFCSIAISFQVF
jgi:hypothetical protein